MEARAKAHSLLCDIVLGGKYSNLLLRKELADVDPKDKGLITNLVYGTMQNSLYLRYSWEKYVDISISPDMALLMDMSIYQFLFMDKLPEYAIVNEAVNIASRVHHGKYKAMINAMLRRFLREGKREIEGNEAEQLSLRTSHPLWLIKMWEKQYSYEIAKKICEDNQGISHQCARVNTKVTSKAGIMAQNEDFTDGNLSRDALVYLGGNIANTKEYLTGLVSIQDEASQCVAFFLDPQKDESILDMCAAPGTKTCHIATLMDNVGEVIALDVHEHRVQLIEQAAARLGMSIVKPWCLDARKVAEEFEESSFDRVLVDAPCTGYGVLKRKSDIKVHMKPNDMDEIIALQKELLNEAAKMVKIKGTLVYSTCTINKKENEKQREAFLASHENYEMVEEKMIFPFEYDTDGFYMAKFIRLN